MPNSRILTAVVCTVVLFAANESKGEDSAEALSGTWVVESLKAGQQGVVKYSETKEPRPVFFITGPHFIWGRLDPKTMKIIELRHSGKLVAGEKKDVFVEEVEHGNRIGKAMEGNSYESTIRLEGEKLIKTRDNKGQLEEQVFVRFRSLPSSDEAASATIGQQLIDLKKAKDAGAISDEEFEKEKAKLLQGSGK